MVSLPDWLHVESKGGRYAAIVLLLVIAIGVRINYYLEIKSGPFYSYHLEDQTDMHFFDLQARQLMAGDWLIEKPLHPHHKWHQASANAYFSKHPDKWLEYLNKGSTKTPEEALWDDWYGGTRYHQEPFYPYLIALIYTIFGPEVKCILLLQLSIGVGCVLLVYLISRQLFGNATALVAGLLVVFSGPIVFYEMILLRATLISFWGLLLVWIFLKTVSEKQLGLFGLLGFICGCALLIKSSFLIVIFGFGMLVAWEYRKNLSKSIMPFAAIGAGLLVALAPLVARNVAVGAPPTGLGSVTAVTLISGIGPKASAWAHIIRPDEVAEVMSMSGEPLPTLIEMLKRKGLRDLFYLMGDKLSALVNNYEVPNNVSFDLFRLFSPTLRTLPVGAGIILPLGLVGIFLALGKFRHNCLALALLALTHLIPILLVVVASRFRVPLMISLIPFAAYAIVKLIVFASSRQFKQFSLLLLPVAVLAIASFRTLPAGLSQIPITYWKAAYVIHYQPRIVETITDKDSARRIQYLEELLAVEPFRLQHLMVDPAELSPEDRETARFFNQVRRIYALTLRELGRNEEAEIVLQVYRQTEAALPQNTLEND